MRGTHSIRSPRDPARLKLAAYWGRVAVAPEDLPLHERDEDEARADTWSPSRYDDPAGPLIDDASG